MENGTIFIIRSIIIKKRRRRQNKF